MRATPGKLLLGIGALHEAVGVAAGLGAIAPPDGPARNLFREILAAGVVGAVEADRLRTVLFWYLFFGLLLLMLGWALDRWEVRGDTLPASIGWQLVALALGGGLLIPASGFWLALVPGVLVLRRAYERRPARSRALTL
jgi:hypothetical protein